METFLSDIKPSKKVRVKNIHGVDATRLFEMGITPGLEIELIRKAPLGFPIEIKVRGYLLSLRESEAKCIEIEE
ncbi:MAG: FeoA family protein [Balneolaceae bacterium]